MDFAVVIPVRDEAHSIGEALGSVRRAAGGRTVEVLVVDGGSRDGTPALAAGLGARVVSAEGGRGGQLAAGVRATTAGVVVLLHADTWLPADAFDAVERVLSDRSVVGGGFRKEFRDGPELVRRGARRRSEVFFRLTGIVLGDQSMFVRRDALERVGGIPRQPLMEDVELCRRLAWAGRLELADAVVSTSGRRFGKRGPWGTWWLMARILAAYWIGVPPATLERWYRRTA